MRGNDNEFNKRKIECLEATKKAICDAILDKGKEDL